MKAKPTTTYVTASPATWELIRAAYLSGQSAPTVSARFGISVGGLRKRAARDGWTKRRFVAAGGAVGLAAQGPAASATAAPVEDPTLAALHARAVPGHRHSALGVARMAVNQAAEGLMAGDADTALRAVRAAEAIVRLEALFRDREDCDDEVEDAREAEARLSAYNEFTFQVAGELAGLLMNGKAVPPGYLAQAERWRAKYAADGVFEAAPTQAEADAQAAAWTRTRPRATDET